MLTENEQLILLTILKKKIISRKEQNIILGKSWFKIMKKLEENGLIMGDFHSNSDNHNRRIYRLTDFGELVAMILSKFNETPKNLKDNKTTIRWFFTR